MLDLTPKTTSFEFGGKTVTLETGRVARQATGAVVCTIEDTVVLATVVAKDSVSPGQDFFPLSVHYQEKFYSVGRIPGGYLKREGRPSEKETLTSRLIDRPIRPLFPKGFMNEVQVIINVLSANKTDDPDIAAMIATSAALAVSGIPFSGPIGAARVGYTDEGGYVINPSYETLASSKLDMVVAGTESAVLMVESEADELSEDQMLGAVLFAHQEFQSVITAIKAFAAENAKPAWDWQPEAENEELKAKVSEAYAAKIAECYQIADKMQRYAALNDLRADAVEKIAVDEGEPSADDVSAMFSKIEKLTVRQRIVAGEPRIDGRDGKTVRPIKVEVGVLPGAHGSALFTRGETQALVTTTLGTLRDGKMEDMLHGTMTDNFMLHYNFPPFSVGEAGRMGGVGRREIGHGRLAKRGVLAMMPTTDDFPYTVRVVSEITESNGSSSMASVCGASLAMMDAGVPVKNPVAGIAMGLVKEGDGFTVLTDILGDEDHLGDMDFKVAGTEGGITALQMDIKIQGITEEIMEIALEQALDARLHILREMAKVIGYSRPELPDNAPTMDVMKVDQDKIRDVIGKGGATIRSIIDQTGAEVDIQDDGTVRIYGSTKEGALAARNMILAITAEPEIGEVYKGKVARLADFGAFVTFLPGKDGLVHISQIAQERIEKVTDKLKEGEEVIVKVLDVDARGRVKLSIKEVTEEDKAKVAE
ncbi:polyribonucleotide nucleotidyltransferase [Reinekea marinisedimentorum]|uniref:Polyribonucleotide nucleotidyltransferase n=1 Tax=Reinekea marinisedimentorum TaxID=230495 RepID=A0A4V2UJ11_9GAMM|nr:polyribonucleotide nucleotidyltransferase [Reinekea marinisedimentorum]TCS38220.1 polyribonucleotide nucleotidyltransferase [Reinekea marinisedimentorum]